MQELEGVFMEALKKFEKGEAKYGPFNPVKDQRDFIAEATDELLDSLNYIGMFVLKLRATMRGQRDHAINSSESVIINSEKGAANYAATETEHNPGLAPISGKLNKPDGGWEYRPGPCEGFDLHGFNPNAGD